LTTIAKRCALLEDAIALGFETCDGNRLRAGVGCGAMRSHTMEAGTSWSLRGGGGGEKGLAMEKNRRDSVLSSWFVVNMKRHTKKKFKKITGQAPLSHCLYLESISVHISGSKCMEKATSKI
jgi:hypothetical protein